MEGGFSAPRELQHQFKELGIDGELTFHILNAYNKGRYDSVEPVHVSSLPEVDGSTVLDLTGEFAHRFPVEQAESALDRLGIDLDVRAVGRVEGETLVCTRKGLEAIGHRLSPLVAYGILNGGSATSYTDLTKNRTFSSEILEISRQTFERIAQISSGVAKGITPAFVHPDGTPGPSYVELKMRSLLIEEVQRRSIEGTEGPALFPMFQMTSVNNDSNIQDAYRRYCDSPLLRDLIEETGVDITRVLTGVQPMIAAFTHDRFGRPKKLFTGAYGEPGRLLPLPGGHGQNFQVLKGVYEELHRIGKRFVILGNVDNLGNTVDPAEIALLALSGRQAGFDFAFKTPVDVKGGILVRDQHGRLDCADIGPAVSHEEVAAAEATGIPIFFNCATGLFNLDYLVANLDRIIEELPMRWSNQDKDAGAYSQAEQVTWEIIGMLDDFFVFGVNKYERFLAAKLLLENLITSGIGLDDGRFPTDRDPARDLKGVARRLHAGLVGKLTGSYGMRLAGNRWVPMSIREIQEQGGADRGRGA